jgi:hypothetical protein
MACVQRRKVVREPVKIGEQAIPMETETEEPPSCKTPLRLVEIEDESDRLMVVPIMVWFVMHREHTTLNCYTAGGVARQERQHL